MTADTEATGTPATEPVPHNDGSSISHAGHPRRLGLFREGLAAAAAQPVATAVATLITAAVCAVVLAITGQAAAAEHRVVSSIDSAGPRTIVFSDPTGSAELVAAGLDKVAELPGVDWIAATGPVHDVRTTALDRAGTPVLARALYTDLPRALMLTDGRRPESGEAIAGVDAGLALGLIDAAGSVTGSEYSGPVVGAFTATDPLADLSTGVLIRTESSPDEPLRTLTVVANTIHDVEALERAIPAILHMTDRFELRIESPATLVDLQTVVAGELGASSRQLMILILTVGLVLTAVTLYGATANRKRDFGRRRALGASRSAIITLVLTHTTLAAATGAALGTASGLTILNLIEGSHPAPTFTAGVAVLTILTAMTAAIPPAVAAATRDPVRILRVP